VTENENNKERERVGERWNRRMVEERRDIITRK